jgi:hypothetical protein
VRATTASDGDDRAGRGVTSGPGDTRVGSGQHHSGLAGDWETAWREG